jgi:hypothetical protein
MKTTNFLIKYEGDRILLFGGSPQAHQPMMPGAMNVKILVTVHPLFFEMIRLPSASADCWDLSARMA